MRNKFFIEPLVFPAAALFHVIIEKLAPTFNLVLLQNHFFEI